MTFEYVALGDPDTVLDTVTIDPGADPVYATGKARRMVEGLRDTLGADAATEALRSWSNGYAATREITTT